MQENNDKYTYEEIDGKIVTVEEAKEIHKKQKMLFRLKIVALCLFISNGVIHGKKLIDHLDNNDVGLEQDFDYEMENINEEISNSKNVIVDESSLTEEQIAKAKENYLANNPDVIDATDSEIIQSEKYMEECKKLCEEAYESGQAAALSFGANAVKDSNYTEHELEVVRNAYNQGYENGLKVYNEVKEVETENDKLEKKDAKLSRTDLLKSFVDKGLSIDEAENEVLALEEKSANESDCLTTLESFFVEREVKNIKNSEEAEQLFGNLKSNHNDYQNYKRLVFFDKNAGHIVITTPYNLSDYWNENDYEFIGSSDNINVFVYEKEVRNIRMDDTDNYSVISDWAKTGEYVVSDERESFVDNISTRYSLRAFSVRGEGIERKAWHPYANGISENSNLNEISKDKIVDTSKIADNVYDAARGNFISQDKIYEEFFSDENIRELNDYGIVEGMNIQSIESNDGSIIGYTVDENITSGKIR